MRYIPSKAKFMFREKTPEKDFFEPEIWMGPRKVKRIRKTWAEPFQKHILPILLESEKDFADLYSPDMGAPNKPVAILLGLLILKEMNDLTDRKVLEHFEFDLLWQHALDTPANQTNVSERTLFNFRKHLAESGKHISFFRSFTDRIIKKWSLSTKVHRMDSTVIMSNMKILSRLQLFIRTIEKFLKKLKNKHPNMLKALPRRFRERYLDREGYFADAKPSKCRRRLEECAQDLCELVNRFRNKKPTFRWDVYKTMERVMKEQVEFREDEDGKAVLWFREPKKPGENQDPRGEVALKAPKDIGGDTLQNPSDPDATYSGHKGPGYKVQLAETCDKSNPFQVISSAKVEQAHESDQGAAEEIHKELKERGHDPKTSYADSAYISGENIVKAKDEGIDLKGPLPGKEPEKEKEVTLGDFTYDESLKKVKTCPAGHAPLHQEYDEETGTLEALFDGKKCKECPHAKICPAKKKGEHRVLKTTREKAATSLRRKEEKTKGFKEDYKIRSGVESTNSHLKNDQGMGQLRVRGSPSVEIQVSFKIMGLDVSRALSYVLRPLKTGLKAPRAALA